MSSFSAAVGTLLKEWNRRSNRQADRAIFRHKLHLESLEDRRLLSVVGPGSGNADSTLASLAANTNAFLEVAPSVQRGTSRGEIQVHLQPGASTFETLPNGEVSLLSAGLDPSGDGGSPQLPAKLVRIALPIDARLDSVALTVSSSREETIPGSYHLTAAPVAAADTESGIVYASESSSLLDGKNQLIYNTDAYYDPACCTLIDVQQMGRWKIAEVSYSPFEYNPVTGSVCLVQDSTLVLSYQTGDPLPASLAASTTWDAEAAGLVVNYGDTGLGYAAAASTSRGAAEATSTASYVVITTSAIQSHSTQLANFVAQKQSLGFSVAVETESVWGGGTGNTAAEHIRSWLQANYATLGIEYVLLIGNPDPSSGDVPMKMAWPNSSATSDRESPTDYYYSDLTSNWNTDGDGMYGEWGDDITAKPLHEVLVGRIPVYSAAYTTLDSVLSKTMNYIAESDITWRKNVLLPEAISNFANQGGSGDARCDGASLGEDIKNDLATPHGFGSYTMYETANTLAPVTVPCNQVITETNVRTQWSGNPYGIVDWWGHGSSTGAYITNWTWDVINPGVPDSYEVSQTPFFQSSDATSLNNNRPSVVVQISCTNGQPEDTSNLGYALLKNGAIGTFSGSRVTWYAVCDWNQSLYAGYGDNASYAYQITQLLVNNQLTESLGAALQTCRENGGTGWAEASWMNCTDFNLYGDPSVVPFRSGSLVDPTPPTVTGVPNDGAGADIDYQISTTTLSANWAGVFADPDTGIAGYEWAVGTTAGGTNILGYTAVGTATSASGSLSMTSGTKYYVTVRATNGGGLQSTATSDGVTPDNSVPSVTGTPSDGLAADIDYQASTTTISANWAGCFSDPQSGITGYEWAIYISGGANIQPYTSVGTATSATNSSLSLTPGTTYNVTVRATNGVGMTRLAGTDGVMVETPPTVTGVPNDGTGADIDYQASATSLSANWAGVFADPETGITGYEWAIGTTAGGTNILGYTSVGTATSASANFSLTSGTKYYVTVRASNGAGLQATATADGVTPDTSQPGINGSPRDGLAADITYQTSTTTISANWDGCFADPQSGIAGYEWAIYISGGANIQPYTSVGTATSATNSSLSLTSGTTYIVNVRATNGAGLTRLAGSDGVTVDATPPTATGVPNDGLGADVDVQSSTTALSANWASVFADAQSGVTAYEWAIGTTAGGTNVQNYTGVGTSTSATNGSLSLSLGTTYYVTVRAHRRRRFAVDGHVGRNDDRPHADLGRRRRRGRQLDDGGQLGV